MGKEYVTMYAKLQCNMGCMENYLNVGKDHGVYKIGEDGAAYPVMNASDTDEEYNIPNFGKCSSPTNPDKEKQSFQEKLLQNFKNLFNGDGTCACVPEIVTPWYDVNDANQLEHGGALTESSKLACIKGGIISIVKEKKTEESE